MNIFKEGEKTKDSLKCRQQSRTSDNINKEKLGKQTFFVKHTENGLKTKKTFIIDDGVNNDDIKKVKVVIDTCDGREASCAMTLSETSCAYTDINIQDYIQEETCL